MPCRLGVESEGQVVQLDVWLRLELRGQPLAVADVVDKDVQQRNLGGGGEVQMPSGLRRAANMSDARG